MNTYNIIIEYYYIKVIFKLTLKYAILALKVTCIAKLRNY
jgi:hypothetical protein